MLFSYRVQVGRATGGIAGNDGFVCEHPSSLASRKSSIAETNALPQFGSLQQGPD